jgi:hypothetical protein
VLGQAVPTTLPTAQCAVRRSYLITDGLSKDGKVALVANNDDRGDHRSPVQVGERGQPEVADVTPGQPDQHPDHAKKPARRSSYLG